MVIALVKGLIQWLNAFPLSNGVTDTMSTEFIVLGKHNPDLNHKKLLLEIMQSYTLKPIIL